MKYLLILLLSFSTQAEYIDIKLNTKGEYSLSTMFHVKHSALLSSEIRAAETTEILLGVHKGYREKSFFIAGGYEVLVSNSKIYNGASINFGYSPVKAEYALSAMVRYNEYFTELETNIGLHYRFSEKVYFSLGSNMKNNIYIGIRRWI